MINILVVGMGEIGRPLFEIISESKKYNVYGFDIDESKCSENIKNINNNSIDIMHVCIPCKDMQIFIKTVSNLYNTYKPDFIIINSTVPPLTTNFVADVFEEYESKPLVVHSPTFGTHHSKEKMKEQFKIYPHFIGPVTKEAGEVVKNYYLSLLFNPIVYSSPLETEIMKIMETTYTGWMITFFNEFHRMALHYGANFPQIVDAMIKTYEPNKNKPIWFPSIIEGHCIMQNINLLLEGNVYTAGFLELIKESNELRKEELLDPKISEDIEKIKQLRKDWLKREDFKDGYGR